MEQFIDDSIRLIVDAIDTELGSGYARNHPEIIAAEIQRSAIWRLAAAIENAGESIACGCRDAGAFIANP
jgi:hypothetical protein